MLKILKKLFLVFLLLFFIVSCVDSLQTRKRQSEALKRFARLHFIQEDYTKALSKLLEAEKVYPEDSEVHNSLGLAYMKKGNTRLAIKHLEKAVKLNPDYSHALNNLGTAYIQNREWDKAVPRFEKVLSDMLYDTPFIAASNLAFVYYNKKEYAKAGVYYQKALKKKPDCVKALHGMGLTLAASEKYDKAAEYIKKAADIAPLVARINFDLAQCYKKAGKREKAIELYKKTIKIDKQRFFTKKAVREIKRLE